MKFPVILAILFAVLAHRADAALGLSQSSCLYTVVGGKYDYIYDQQTGVGGGDIVGDQLRNHGFFTAYDDSGSVGDLTDDFVAFRMRLSDHDGTPSSPSFERTIWVGIDADLSGSIDVVFGVSRSGNSNRVMIHGMADSGNTGPNNTAIENVPYRVYELDDHPDYMNYRPVGEADYDGFDLALGDTLDASEDGTPDYYISFMLPFVDLMEYLAHPENTGQDAMLIDDTTPLRYLLASATQDNVINQDFGGIGSDYDADATWSELGVFSQTVTITGEVVVPEPSLWVLVMVGVLVVVSQRSRRQVGVCKSCHSAGFRPRCRKYV